MKPQQRGNSPPVLHFGLTGSMGSGKGEVVNLLVRKGFRSISLSDMVRREAARVFASGAPLSRDALQTFGNRMRDEQGAGWLGARVREEIQSHPPQPWVIDGIRNPAEVAELRKLERFFLIGIEADRSLIISRLNQRQRDSDRRPIAELEANLQREWGQGEPDHGQQVARCLAESDFTISNNGTRKELHRAVDDILVRVEAKHE